MRWSSTHEIMPSKPYKDVPFDDITIDPLAIAILNMVPDSLREATARALIRKYNEMTDSQHGDYGMFLIGSETEHRVTCSIYWPRGKTCQIVGYFETRLQDVQVECRVAYLANIPETVAQAAVGRPFNNIAKIPGMPDCTVKECIMIDDHSTNKPSKLCEFRLSTTPDEKWNEAMKDWLTS